MASTPSPADLGRSIVWFPAVGAALGAAIAVLDALATPVFSPSVASALVVFALVSATGAFHLDGLIDTVDGLVAGPTPAERLAAMRRSVAGVPGALAGCGMLLATFVVILNLPDPLRARALFLAPLCGRTTILTGYWLFPYGRPEAGVSRALKEGASTPRVVTGGGAALALAVAVGHGGGAMLLVGSVLAGAAIGLLVLRRLPGLTGDVHGAICELTQFGALLLAPTALAR